MCNALADGLADVLEDVLEGVLIGVLIGMLCLYLTTQHRQVEIVLTAGNHDWPYQSRAQMQRHLHSL